MPSLTSDPSLGCMVSVKRKSPMNRRVIMLAAAGVFVITAAFAAQPTSVRDGNRQGERAPQREPWVPGDNALMSAHDATAQFLAPPR